MKEIVRCKDCKHRPILQKGSKHPDAPRYDNGEGMSDYTCPCLCEDNWYSWMPEDNWFCANGEMK